MPVKTNDELARIIGTPIESSRINSLLWFALAQSDKQFIDIHSISTFNRDELASFIKNIGTLSGGCQWAPVKLVPDTHLSWIEDSQRQSHWLTYQLVLHISASKEKAAQAGMHHQPLTNPSPPRHLTGRNLSIAYLDFFSAHYFSTIDEKINFIESLQLSWQNHTKTDRYFSWLNRNDASSRIEFFWEWLTKKNPEITHNRPFFKTYEGVLEFFDNPAFTESAKELFNKKANNMWAQKQRRENSKNKRQCNFVLAEKTISKLEKLAAKHHLTRTEIIELIINAEAEKETYIRERLSRRQLLLGSPEPTE